MQVIFQTIIHIAFLFKAKGTFLKWKGKLKNTILTAIFLAITFVYQYFQIKGSGLIFNAAIVFALHDFSFMVSSLYILM